MADGSSVASQFIMCMRVLVMAYFRCQQRWDTAAARPTLDNASVLVCLETIDRIRPDSCMWCWAW